jgi:hypothetical protein
MIFSRLNANAGDGERMPPAGAPRIGLDAFKEPPRGQGEYSQQRIVFPVRYQPIARFFTLSRYLEFSRTNSSQTLFAIVGPEIKWKLPEYQ